MLVNNVFLKYLKTTEADGGSKSSTPKSGGSRVSLCEFHNLGLRLPACLLDRNHIT